jgi:hypothetical protein
MDWRFDSEMAFLSDRGFLNEYFRTEYAETKPLETVQYFRKLKDNAGLTIGFQEKLNDFTTSQFQGDPTGTKSQGLTVGSYLESPLYDTTLQKFPEIGYHQTGQPLFNSLFTYNTDTRFDAVNLQYDSDLLRQFPDLPAPYFTPKVGNLYVPLQNPPTTARVDTRHDASMPFDIGPVRIEPMFSSRIQAESNSAHTNAGMIDNGDPLARLIAGPQVVATTNFWRIYDAHSKLLDVNHIKHIITPQFRYENSVIATESSDRFHNFDPYSTVERQADQLGNTRFVPVVPLPQSFNDFDRVESMDNMQRLVVELRQRLQTKRGRPGYEETVDLAELRLDYTVFPGDAGLNRDFKEVYGDFVRADAFWQLTKDIIVESRDNQVNTIAGEVELANIGVNFSFPPDWTLYVGQRYIRDARNVALSVLPGNIQSSNMTILGLEYTVSPKYAVTVVEQYDFTSHRNATTRVVVSRKLPGWVLDLTADVNPTDNDTAMTVQLTPMGLKQGMRRFW